ncbi:hypothetical protein SAMN02745883_02146 [Caminicella sporogenes DSM 14501]|uniref:Uncharacterized protein n=1 Tax=Caminicella sporogenes DSM 14501 TaxID=1121266 RepID=A0A1M6SSY8_9FIRM|nr:hypothetical protein [Caminicella sporogenes]RKD26398.1 hypothetical protein BET04_10570 [Caminicella sporogenes]SHK47852.1 hypothetical protein SAMN02745883_02146 [Caminicella sporogenes DSM 14501]
MWIVDSLNILDEIRITKGFNELKNYFYRLIQSNPQNGINLLNSHNLRFSSLFILQPEIQKLNLYEKLNTRNKIALDITKEILTREKKFLIIKYTSSEYSQIAYSILKWMFETGFTDDGFNNQFDEVLDIIALLLIKIYKETSILPIIADMIFKRNKENLYIHDLVWAFLESRNPNSLILIANRLLSKETSDNQLALNLLSFIPTLKKSENKEKQYISVVEWLEDNYPFLYFKGENLQQKNKPVPYIVILEGKYLCKNVSVNTGKIINSLTVKEQKLLDDFNKLDKNTKILLSDFSYSTYKKNNYLWKKWINRPINEQIRIVQSRMGGIQ